MSASVCVCGLWLEIDSVKDHSALIYRFRTLIPASMGLTFCDISLRREQKVRRHAFQVQRVTGRKIKGWWKNVCRSRQVVTGWIQKQQAAFECHLCRKQETK